MDFWPTYTHMFPCALTDINTHILIHNYKKILKRKKVNFVLHEFDFSGKIIVIIIPLILIEI